ncbi:hypothetical protein Xmau_03865 [Xenorhabdus mauleonii]|uniref:Uncharacterized protein n=1 Tax=Xenorhabdus mauleonii TaxID=351675 RepID=A0A1I3V6M7_9GAMM|nr:hypothetical protein [Xenorhabdus mauleonii]PHM37647.1 hypothetical protein Xmau_03865 [Xenorhabdus mauleonii]SFJ90800.1 hypothetical protein SAMN05421680_11969 [Xenorhabdus mauleonii]
MSVCTLSDKHFSAVVLAYETYHINCFPLNLSWYEAKEKVGEILHQANLDSFNYRYKEDLTGTFVFDSSAPQLSVPAVLKALDCIEYQCCEVESYQQTRAYKIIKQLRLSLIDKIDGYEEAHWFID